MENIVRKGQTVYAADGTLLGGVLQCDSHFLVVGRSRWTSDHFVIPVEEVAASGSNLLILRALPEDMRPETAEPWTPAPDPSGNANGVDIEPLRAGMAEIEDAGAGIAASPEVDAAGEASTRRAIPDPLLPSPEDARGLERERVARLDAEIDRHLVDELEDFELGAGCAPPAAEETPRGTPAVSPPRPLAPHVRRGERAVRREVAGPAATLSPAAMKATRSTRAFERILRRSGFSPAEARAIATGGFDALVSLAGGLARPQGHDDS
jgi:hypothetical protein